MPAFSFDNYKWAHAVMDSRAIWWNGERHLVPLLDLINCAEGPNPSRVHATALDSSGRNAVTHADRAYKPGEQIFENYGQPNHIYFEFHGFVLDQNTHDCVRITHGIPEDDSKGAASRRAALEKRGVYETRRTLCLAPGKVSQDDVKFIAAIAGVPAKDSKAARLAVAQLCEAKLDGYPTTLEEDEHALRFK
jgi:hypothetical protein